MLLERREAFLNSSLQRWSEVAVIYADHVEYPVVLETDDWRIKAAIEVSHPGSETETFLKIPVDGEGRFSQASQRNFFADRAKACLIDGLKLQRKGLSDVRFSSLDTGTRRFFSLALEGDNWAVWDRSKQSFPRRARGFAQTLVNRINRDQNEPLVMIYPELT